MKIISIPVLSFNFPLGTLKKSNYYNCIIFKQVQKWEYDPWYKISDLNDSGEIFLLDQYSQKSFVKKVTLNIFKRVPCIVLMRQNLLYPWIFLKLKRNFFVENERIIFCSCWYHKWKFRAIICFQRKNDFLIRFQKISKVTNYY